LKLWETIILKLKVTSSVVHVNGLGLTLCVSVNVEYKTCKCKNKYIYIILHSLIKKYKYITM